MATSILEQSTTNKPTRFYRPELDSLRFFAFLLVFFTHEGMRSYRWEILRSLFHSFAFGVPVFFMLSAYLITELLRREKKLTGTVSLRLFYLRRILRIWPLYFLMLFLCFGLSHGLRVEPVSVRTLLAYLFLAGNWDAAVHGSLPLGFLVLWSLTVEEQFYLVWPSVVRFTNEKTLLLACGGLWACSQLAFLVFYLRHSSVTPYVYCNSFSYLQFFALGAGISVLLKAKTPPIGAIGRMVLFVAALLLFLLAEAGCHIHAQYAASGQTWLGYLIISLGASSMLMAFAGASIPRWLHPTVYLGKISYGLYVIHLPILGLISYIAVRYLSIQRHVGFERIGIGLPLTVVLASLSYRYFEAPFLRLKERFEIVRSRAV